MILRYLNLLVLTLKSWSVCIVILAQQLGRQLGQLGHQFGRFWNYLRWGWWRIEEYGTLELTIPEFRVGNSDRFRDDLITFTQY